LDPVVVRRIAAGCWIATTAPWYPEVRLFRQSKTKAYGSVMNRVRNELLAQVVQRRVAT